MVAEGRQAQSIDFGMELLQMARLVISPRMKEWSLWALWWLLLGGAILWLLVGSVAYWVLHGWLPAKVEGWVQAFGSIGAVLAAIWIASRQWRLERQSKRDSDAESLKKLVAIARFAGKIGQNAYTYVSIGGDERRQLQVYASKLGQCDQLLASVSYMQVPLSEAALGWVEVRHEIVEFCSVFEAALQRGEMGPAEIETLNASNIRLARAVVRILAGATELLPAVAVVDQ